MKALNLLLVCCLLVVIVTQCKQAQDKKFTNRELLEHTRTHVPSRDTLKAKQKADSIRMERKFGNSVDRILNGVDTDKLKELFRDLDTSQHYSL